jgi:fatty acid desaturase
MSETAASRHEQFTAQHYAREVRPHLPAAIFLPVPSRLLWLPLHLGVVIAMAAYVVGGEAPWYLKLAAALIAGHSWACLSFLAHETLHHAVVRNRLVERVIGYIGLGPYCLSPTLWVAWHNQEHHGNTGHREDDPDAYWSLAEWQNSAVDREMTKASPGSGYKRSVLFLLVTFSLHSLVVLLSHSHRHDYYARISRRVVYAEAGGMLAFWLAVLLLVGPWNFLFVYVVPVFVANAITMSYIATNHHLNSLTSINDSLANTLSVRSWGWLETLHFHFGYHVEHHIFPTVSGRHTPLVRQQLVRLYGERYLSLPHLQALRLIYSRPKIHKTHDTLIDPQTERIFHTLAPGALTMDAAA